MYTTTWVGRMGLLIKTDHIYSNVHTNKCMQMPTTRRARRRRTGSTTTTSAESGRQMDRRQTQMMIAFKGKKPATSQK